MNDPDLQEVISSACEERNPILVNLLITLAHARLSRELAVLTGESAGANFHTWAVWGSKKAGVTIRQEDLDGALRNATVVAGLCGLLIGACVAQLVLCFVLPPWVQEHMGFTLSVLGASFGASCGALVGRFLAYSSRSKAAALVLEGNILVLNDIGRRTADFVRRFRGRNSDSPITSEELDEFITASVQKPGSDSDTELLQQAFEYYARAVNESDEQNKQQATYFANCLAILHEHKKLQPYIKKSLPVIVSRCVTKRMLSFDIGSKQLAVSESIPSLEELSLPPTLESLEDPALNRFLEKWSKRKETNKSSAARDWTKIEERMSYIVDLFRYCHLDPGVFEPPYTEEQCMLINEGKIPPGKL